MTGQQTEDFDALYGRLLAQAAARESAVMIGATRHWTKATGAVRYSGRYFEVRDVLTHTAATLAEISAESGAAPNTVRTHLATMIAEGIVTRTKVINATGSYTNFYALKPGVLL